MNTKLKKELQQVPERSPKEVEEYLNQLRLLQFQTFQIPKEILVDWINEPDPVLKLMKKMGYT
jgi:hypothetical protein